MTRHFKKLSVELANAVKKDSQTSANNKQVTNLQGDHQLRGITPTRSHSALSGIALQHNQQSKSFVLVSQGIPAAESFQRHDQ